MAAYVVGLDRNVDTTQDCPQKPQCAMAAGGAMRDAPFRVVAVYGTLDDARHRREAAILPLLLHVACLPSARVMHHIVAAPVQEPADGVEAVMRDYVLADQEVVSVARRRRQHHTQIRADAVA